MARKRMRKGVRGEAVTSSGMDLTNRCCKAACRYFLGESAKIPGAVLCSNPNFIRLYEGCLSTLGAECDYYTIDDSDPTEAGYTLFEHTGKENRRYPRNLVYNSMLLRIERGREIVEYPSVILDISLEGIGCIIPVAVELFPQKFYLIKKSSADNQIELICQTRRVIRHSSVTEIGAVFIERISEEVLASLTNTR